MFRRPLVLYLMIMILAGVPCFSQQEAAGPFSEVETSICASIEDRQPMRVAASFAPDCGQVYFWTKCVGAADSTFVTHVWVHEGETRATVELPVKSSNWRTWSSKKILPSWTGNWEVRILDAAGNILKAETFTIEAQAAPPETAQAEETPETPSDST